MKLSLAFLLLFLSLLGIACSESHVGATSDDVPAAAGAQLAPYRTELLALAFDTASAMPLQPHVKNRSRAQGATIQTCLDLDQIALVLPWIEKIENWRRGEAYAALATKLVEDDPHADVHAYLDMARQIAASTSFGITQDWHRDRIRVGIAKALTLQGKTDEAAQYLQGAEAAEAGRIEATRAQVLGAEDFDGHVAAIEASIRAGGLDEVRAALQACAGLFARFYADETRRERAKAAGDAAGDTVPLDIRIEWRMDLARTALEHQDGARAIELVGEAQRLLDEVPLPVEVRVPLASRLAALRFGAGDQERARQDLDAASKLSDADGAKLNDFERAEVLQPLAEAWQSIGDTPAALTVYRRAVEEGAKNPNARQRAEDLCATCCSMAKSGVEPDAALWARLREIRAGLREPW